MRPLLIIAALAAGCAHPRSDAPHYVATIAPVAAILQEIVGEDHAIHVLLQPGASPHAYNLHPSDARAAETALVLVSVADDLDGWSESLSTPQRIQLMDLLPDSHRRAWEGDGHDDHGDHDHHSGGSDPHFWSDPLAVQALLPSLVDVLIQIDPDRATAYRANAEAFGKKLTELDNELAALLAHGKGQSVILYHPSWHYFLDRYGIACAAVIESAAGKEPTARQIKALQNVVRDEDVKAIFVEPQIAQAPAHVVAEGSGATVATLDPLGGVAGRTRYDELMRSNGRVISLAIR
jgi:zinc transport system substrate-binding protein